MALAVPPDSLMDLQADTEYFSFNLVIDHAKTWDIAQTELPTLRRELDQLIQGQP